jgi:hypothetical protein
VSPDACARPSITARYEHFAHAPLRKSADHLPVARSDATHELIAHLLPLVARRRHVLLTVGWIITDTG